MPLGQTIGAVFYCLNGNRCYKKISDRFSIFLPVMNQNEQQILTRALFCHAAHWGVSPRRRACWALTGGPSGIYPEPGE